MRMMTFFCQLRFPWEMNVIYTDLPGDATIESVKHRLFVFLFKRAMHIFHTSDPHELRKFSLHFDQVMLNGLEQEVCKIN